MKLILNLIIGFVYVTALICLTLIVVLPFLGDGIGVWSNGSEASYARNLPLYFRAICSLLLILLVGGGIYCFGEKFRD